MRKNIAHLVAQYVSINDKGKIGEILQHWPHTEEARIAVVTDGNARAHTIFISIYSDAGAASVRFKNFRSG